MHAARKGKRLLAIRAINPFLDLDLAVFVHHKLIDDGLPFPRIGGAQISSMSRVTGPIPFSVGNDTRALFLGKDKCHWNPLQHQ